MCWFFLLPDQIYFWISLENSSFQLLYVLLPFSSFLRFPSLSWYFHFVHILFSWLCALLNSLSIFKTVVLKSFLVSPPCALRQSFCQFIFSFEWTKLSCIFCVLWFVAVVENQIFEICNVVPLEIRLSPFLRVFFLPSFPSFLPSRLFLFLSFFLNSCCSVSVLGRTSLRDKLKVFSGLVWDCVFSWACAVTF